MTTLGERFWSKVAIRGFEECWDWKAGRFDTGYGAFQFGPKKRGAHRVAYELVLGTIPEGLDLDHLCRNRACVNPNHLQPVTRRENLKRGLRGDLTTHCPKGHPYAGDNLFFVKNRHGNLSRKCRACSRERCKQYDRRRLEAMAGAFGEIE